MQTYTQSIQSDSCVRLSLRSCSVLTLTLFLASACSSPCHRREALVRILQDQNDVITKVRMERTQSQVSQKVQADPDLANAEAHLIAALRAIQESNQSVRETLEPKANDEGEKR